MMAVMPSCSCWLFVSSLCDIISRKINKLKKCVYLFHSKVTKLVGLRKKTGTTSVVTTTSRSKKSIRYFEGQEQEMPPCATT